MRTHLLLIVLKVPRLGNQNVHVHSGATLVSLVAHLTLNSSVDITTKITMDIPVTHGGRNLVVQDRQSEFGSGTRDGVV